MKTCPRCGSDGPFGKDKCRSDKLNLYCKACVLEKVRTHRESKRAYKARMKHLPPRKPSIPVRPKTFSRRVRSLSPEQKVLLAVRQGKTQKEIRSMTGLSVDEISDILAVLVLDLSKVKRVRLPEHHWQSWNGDNWRYVAVG